MSHPTAPHPLQRTRGWCARLFLAALLCWATDAYAQEKKPCAGEESATSACQKSLDRELTRIYLTILDGIRPGFPALLRNDQLEKQKRLFTQAQRAWENYRDRTCEADAFENYDYSGYSSSVADCRIALTRMRIEQLRTGPWGVLLDG